MPRNASRAALWLFVLLVPAAPGAQANDPLVEAVRARDRAAVARLVKQGADVTRASPDGATPLHWAAHRDDLAIARLLIDAGAGVNAATDLGVTPLSLACSGGSASLVEVLLGAGADPRAATSTGETPLMTCARTGNLTAVKALLAAGADVNAHEQSYGQTALMWAVARGQADVIAVLLENGADVHARSAVRSLVVSRGNRYGGVGLQNRAIADTGQGGSTPLLFAARSGDVASARLLVAAGADVNAAGQDRRSALLVAAHSGHTALASFLLEKGADPNASAAGYTAVHAAILRGDLALVEALLARGADPSAPLVNGTAVRRYSQDYALNDAWTGATPFWLAARFAEPGIMRALVARGARTDATLKDGTTALMAAAGLGSGSLLTGSLSLADRRERRVDPAEAALRDLEADERRALEAVRIAVEQGGDVHAVTAAGETALHGAAANGFATVIEYLNERGAALSPKNRRGQTPLALAVARTADGAPGADNRAADLLRRLGAVE